MHLREVTPPAVQPAVVAQDAGKGLLLLVAVVLFFVWAGGNKGD